MGAAQTFKKFYSTQDGPGDQIFAGRLRDSAVMLRNGDRIDTVLPWAEMAEEHRAFVLLMRLPRRFKDMEHHAGVPAEKALAILRGLHAAEVLDTKDLEQARALIPVEVRKALAEVKGTQVVSKKLSAQIYRPSVDGASAGSGHPTDVSATSTAAPPPPAAASPPPSPPPAPVATVPPPAREPARTAPPPRAPTISSSRQKAMDNLEFKQIQQDVEDAHKKLVAGLNHFEVLGLQRDARDEHVKAAYLSLVKKWHPDRLSGFKDAALEDVRAKMAKLFGAVGDANQVLSDAVSRKGYLEDLTKRESAGAVSAAATAKPVRAEEAKLHAAKGRVFLQKKDFPAAEAEYKRAHDYDGGLPEYKTEWAWAIALNPARPDKERREKALTMLQEVTQTSRHAEAHYKMGLILRMMGDAVRADAAFKKANQMDKTHEEAAREVRLMDSRAKTAKEDTKGGIMDLFKRR